MFTLVVHGQLLCSGQIHQNNEKKKKVLPGKVMLSQGPWISGESTVVMEMAQFSTYVQFVQHLAHNNRQLHMERNQGKSKVWGLDSKLSLNSLACGGESL